MKSVYEEVNRVAEKWSKLAFLLLTLVTPIGFFFPKVAFIYFIYYTTDAGSDAFDLPFFMWFPWDWRTPAGYLITVIVQYILTTYLFLFATMSLSIGIGCFVLLNTVVKDICACINSVNDIAKFDGNRLRMIEQLCDFIGAHSCMLELSIMNLFYQLVIKFKRIFQHLSADYSLDFLI